MNGAVEVEVDARTHGGGNGIRAEGELTVVANVDRDVGCCSETDESEKADELGDGDLHDGDGGIREKRVVTWT